MLTLKRIGIYLISFILLVSIMIWLVDWKWLDKYLVNEANKTGKEDFVNKEIVFIQLDHPDTGSEGASFKLFRQQTIQLLNSITAASKNNNKPKGVVLDIWFSSDTTELENLKAALKQLKDLGVPVYASYNINEHHESADLNKINFDEVESKHAIDIYNDYLAGSGGNTPGSGRYHTFFYPEQNVANYEHDIILPSVFGDSVLIESLARKVAMDLNDSKNIRLNPKRVGSLVPFGTPEELEKRTYTFKPDSINHAGFFLPPAGVKDSIDISKNILVVGDAVDDLIDIDGRKVPGPYIVTWALSDLLDNNTRLKLPVESFYVIIGQILFFSFFTALAFALIFKYAKSFQTKPAIIGILS